jgi:hypothetical protein
MTCEIHENDEGTEFIFTVNECDAAGVESPADISTATLMELIMVKEDATRTVFSMAFTTIASGATGDGTDGKVSYFSSTGDFSPVGFYSLQAIITTPAGKWYSTIEEFEVLGNL